MRRVVTGHDANGRAVVIIDDRPAPVVLEKAGGLRLTELWATSEAPARFSETDRARRERRIEPDAMGSVFRVIEYPPDAERLKTLAPEEHFASMGVQAADSAKRRHPGIQVLDDDEVRLSAGDVLVQQGTNHAWSNRTNQPCRIAFVLIDAAA